MPTRPASGVAPPRAGMTGDQMMTVWYSMVTVLYSI